MRKTYLAACLISAMSLSACGGGGTESESSSDNNDDNVGTTPVTEVVSFDLTHGSLDVEERTEFTITASSNIDGISYVWDYTPGAGYSVNIDGDTAAVTVNELTKNAELEFTITASADGYQDDESRLSFNLLEIDEAKLPPALTVDLATREIQGVDTNNNGVRDDAERSIYSLYDDNYDHRIFAWELARVMQQQILSSNLGDEAIEEATKAGLTISYCLSEHVDEQALPVMISHVQNMMLDIDKRKAAFSSFVNNRSEVVVNVTDLNVDACSSLFTQE